MIKVYILSEGNEEFHRVVAAISEWNLAMKFAVEELEAGEEIRENKKDRDGQTVWEYWRPHANGKVEDGCLVRVTQLDLS